MDLTTTYGGIVSKGGMEFGNGRESLMMADPEAVQVIRLLPLIRSLIMSFRVSSRDPKP